MHFLALYVQFVQYVVYLLNDIKRKIVRGESTTMWYRANLLSQTDLYR